MSKHKAATERELEGILWPRTKQGKVLVDDYYAHDDAREDVGFSLGARLADIEAEAAAPLRDALAALVAADRSFDAAEREMSASSLAGSEFERISSLYGEAITRRRDALDTARRALDEVEG